MIAQEYPERAGKAGFDYKSVQDILPTPSEELRELEEASTPDHQFEEMGDVLFIVARIARQLHIDAEEALRHANRKFKRRFQSMENIARAGGRDLASYNGPEWRALWKRAKSDEDHV